MYISGAIEFLFLKILSIIRAFLNSEGKMMIILKILPGSEEGLANSQTFQLINEPIKKRRKHK